MAGLDDASRMVRRTAVDAAADAADEAFRPVFELVLEDEDAWIRWKAVRSLGDLGVSTSGAAVATLIDDPDFQVRFEVARVLREWNRRR
jgi:HEAT repeat protein